MKDENDVEICWEQEQANFNAAIGYYDLEMLDEAEGELNKIDRSAAVDAVPLLALRLNICYKRKHWQKMAAFATYLLLLDEFNPRWAYAHGFATASQLMENEAKQNREAFKFN
jgi:hypothetical protein